MVFCLQVVVFKTA